MRTKTLLSTIALGAGLIAGGATLAVHAQTPARTPAAPSLNLVQVHDRLEAAGYRDIEKIERHRDRYEVVAADRDQRRVELEVDPATAQVMRTERKHDRRDDERRQRERDVVSTPGQI